MKGTTPKKPEWTQKKLWFQKTEVLSKLSQPSYEKQPEFTQVLAIIWTCSLLPHVASPEAASGSIHALLIIKCMTR